MPFSLDNSLSEELIDRIVQLVEPHSALLPLCLANKKISRIATPHLYANVDLKDAASDTGTKHLLPFTFLMWESSTHASFVRSFSIRGTWSEEAGTPESSPDPNDKWARRPWPEHDRLETILKSKVEEHARNEKEAEALYKAIEHGGNEEAVLALLLPSLPKLRKLDLSPGLFLEEKALVHMLERLGKREKPFDSLPENPEPDSGMPFACLTDVLMGGEDDKYPNSPEYFYGALRLPNLRRLYGYRLGENEQDEMTESLKTLKPESSSVEYIELRCSKLFSDDTDAVLRACKPGTLKIFMYEIGCAWAWVPVQHDRILAALAPHAPHLEALCLSHEDYYPYQENEGEGIGDENPCALQFTHFTALKRLKLAPVFVWGHKALFNPPPVAQKTRSQKREVPDYRAKLWRSLPPNIEELWITRARDVGVLGYEDQTTPFVTDHLLPALEEVLLMKAKAFPRLKRLRLEGPMHELSKWGIDIARFLRLAESHNVVCTLVNMIGDYPYDEADCEEAAWGWYEDVDWKECMHNQQHTKRMLEYPSEGVTDLEAALEKVCRKLKKRHSPQPDGGVEEADEAEADEAEAVETEADDSEADDSEADESE